MDGRLSDVLGAFVTLLAFAFRDEEEIEIPAERDRRVRTDSPGGGRAMSVAVAVDRCAVPKRCPAASEAGPASKRIVVAYGFWIFLLSDIVMFSALFAAYAVLVRATAGGPTGVAALQSNQRRDRDRLSSRLELHVRADVAGGQCAAPCRHLFRSLSSPLCSEPRSSVWRSASSPP